MSQTLPSSRLRDFEHWAAVLGFVAFSGIALSADALQGVEAGGVAPSDPILTMMKAGAFAYGLWGMLQSWRELRFSWATASLMGLHILAFVSAAWSDAPSLTISRSIQLALTTAFALAVVLRFSRQEIAGAFCDALWITIALNLVSLLVIPDLTRMTGEFEGAWRGLFAHKNQLGKFAVMSAGMMAYAPGSSSRSRMLSAGGMAASLLLVVGSTSRTALVTTAAVWMSFPVFRYLRRQRTLLPHAVALGALVGVSAMVVWTHAEDLAELMGRDLTLSGRTALWFAVVAFIIQRPWLGYGYAAFWRGMEGNSAYISLALHWDVPHAHNGWLDVALDVGAAGVVLITIFFISAVRGAFADAKASDRYALWSLTAVTVVIMANLTESSLLRPNNLTWVLLLLAAQSRFVRGAPPVAAEEERVYRNAAPVHAGVENG